MQDRLPGAPGQYKATLTAAEFQKMQAGEQFTITMIRDDHPIVEGTPYSKAAVLPDDLAATICPDVLNPTPADALAALMPRNGTVPMAGPLDMNSKRVMNVAAPAADGDAVNLGYAKKVGNPHNLLDNGDFRNPVNQRGITNGTVRAWTHFIDRWTTGNAECQVSFGETGISINGDVMQYVTMGAAHKTLTLAAKINGIVYACSGVYQCADAFTRIAYQNLDPAGYITIDDLGGQKIRVLFHQTGAISVEWVALYEGEYTTENLPEYQPKGHAAEFAECRRYYQKGEQTVTIGTQHGSADNGMIRLRFENMRVTPSITITGVSSQGWGNLTPDRFASGWNSKNGADYCQNYIVSGDSTYVGQTIGVDYEASADIL